MARNVDFAFLFRGGADGKLLPFKLENLTAVAIDTKPYEAAKKAKNSTRQLFTLSTGGGDEADGNLQPHVDKLIAFVKEKTSSRLDNLGACVIVGNSNGAALALALAARLTADRAPTLKYVGVCNVPIMPFGRQPGVPLLGPLNPSKGPEFKNETIFNLFSHPLMDREDPPVVIPQSPIRADKKRSFFERQGNHAKVFRRPPGSVLPGWWWHSDMFAGEVHGKVEDFDNKEFRVFGAGDFGMHDAICTGIPFNQMRREAAEALADFPV